MHAAVFGLDVLKIDVEGAELRVVLGMRALLESGPAVVVELHAPDLLAGVSDLLRERGYRGELISGHMPVQMVFKRGARKPLNQSPT